MNLNPKTEFIINKLRNSSIWEPVDEALIPIVNALNAQPGLTSDVCCEGHGDYFPYIYFTLDGTSQSLQSLGRVQTVAKSQGWLTLPDTINGIDEISLYFCMLPKEAFSAATPKDSLIKIKLPTDLDGSAFLDDLEKISQKIQRNFRETILKKPLFSFPA